MNLEVLKIKITELQKEVDILEAEPQAVIERASKERRYWMVDEELTPVSTFETSYPLDDSRFKSYNYFTDEKQCEAVAKHIRESFLFMRKAIEFADGHGGVNGFRVDCVLYIDGEFKNYNTVAIASPTTIYMSEQNAILFAAWCNEHKKELGYE